MNLNQIISPVEQRQISRRAWAHFYLEKAVAGQHRNPCEITNWSVEYYKNLALSMGLTEDEANDTIQQTRREEEPYGTNQDH